MSIAIIACFATCSLTFAISYWIWGRKIQPLTIEKNRLEERMKLAEEHKQNLPQQFENIAKSILSSQQEMLAHKNAETLKPLKEQIEAFRNRSESLSKEQEKEMKALQTHLEHMQKQASNLGKEANNLTEALRGQKQQQGAWGEYQLVRLLELMEYKEGIDYHTQKSEKNDEGKTIRPDVIVNLPNSACLVIDSKVSLENYWKYIETEGSIEKKDLLNQYVNDIKRQIKNLSTKEYQKNYTSSPDYVVIFLPVEAAYIAAISEDSSLMELAHKSNIALSTPSSLVPILRTIQNLWRIEKQNKNVQDITKHAGNLVDRFSDLLHGITKVQDQLKSANNTIDKEIITKISGQQGIQYQIEKLQKLGAKGTKTFPKEWENEGV